MTSDSQLVMTRGPETGQTFPLDKDSLGLGREPSNDIVIDHPQVSRRHARIVRQGGLMVIEDLGSTNGTFANGIRLSGPHTLAEGDVIGLGEAVLLTYRTSDTAATERLVGRSVAAPPTQAGPFLDAQPSPLEHSIPPPSVALPEEKKGYGWLRIGCGCLAILLIIACVGVFVLDYLKILPAFFYEPLRWLGLI